MKIIVIGIAIVLAIVSAGYLWFNIPQQPICTINQIPGEVITIDKTMDNAIVCTNASNTITFRMPLWDRVEGVWFLSNSSGLQVSEGIRDMPDRNMPGFGTIAWEVTTTARGVHTLKAVCKRGGDHKLLAGQNLTVIVR